MSREAQAIVLFLLGGGLCWAAFTDLSLRYVRPELRPLLVIAGVVLIAAAVATAWYEWRKKGHTHAEHRVSRLMLLPLFALLLVAPPALGSYTAVRTGTALQPPPVLTPLSAEDPLPLALNDYAARAVYDDRHELAGRQVVVTGFISADADGEPYLTRMVLNCCAADAQPIKIGLAGQVPAILQPDTWFEVTGTFVDRQSRDPVNDGPIPYIDITRAVPVPAPSEPYETW